MERAENLARILDVNETFARDRHSLAQWMPIVEINADEELFREAYPNPSAQSVIQFYVLDKRNPTSISSAVSAARENARAIRHLISTESWTHLNVFNRTLQLLDENEVRPENLPRLCAMIKENCQTHAGITLGTFYQDQVFFFYFLGKHIERADQTSRLIDMKYQRLAPGPEGVDDAVDAGEWTAVLRSVAGYQAFRRVHPRGLRPEVVAAFLLYDNAFPRSVALCVEEIEDHLSRLRRDGGIGLGDDLERAFETIKSPIRERRFATEMGSGLHRDMDLIQAYLIDLSKKIAERFFGAEVESDVKR